MEAHELANIFPMMNEEDFNNLKKDIEENGFDESRAIVVYEEKILDGRNRNKACEELGIKPIFRNYDGESPLYYVISNNLNRRHLNESQRAVVAMRMANLPLGIKKADTPIGVSQEEASELMHIGKASLQRAKELQEKTPEAIERIEKGETTIGKEYGELKKAEAETPEWLRYLDVWNFKENTGEGISNLPPEILKNLLYYYTEEGDLIIDPFAGSGQIKEVCDEMNRRCFCSDLNPKKDFIKKWDVDKGFPQEVKECDFIFLDPPYWNMVSYGDGWSNTSLEDFYAKFERFMKHCDNILKEDGKIALIIMPLKREGYLDLGFECYQIMKKHFNIEQRICIPLVRNWALDVRLKQSKENKEILTGSLRDLIVFKKKSRHNSTTSTREKPSDETRSIQKPTFLTKENSKNERRDME